MKLDTEFITFLDKLSLSPDPCYLYKHLDFREINQTEDSDTIFMVNNILKPKDLEESIDQMISFCEVFNQKELIELLQS